MLKRRDPGSSLHISIPTLKLKPFEEDANETSTDFVMVGVQTVGVKLTTAKSDGLQGKQTATARNGSSSTRKTDDSSSSGNMSATGIVEKWKTFPEALASQASKSGLIILALVDSGFMDMAANYYITSIHKFDLHKLFLFIALDRSVCLRLQENLQALGSIPCFRYGDDKDAEKASKYGSIDFHRKTNSRNTLILEALKLGYTVLNTDTDLYFFSNPLPDVISTCERNESGCDVAPLWDNADWNTGFIYVRPTNRSIALYTEMIKRYQQADKDDQLIMSDVIKSMAKNKAGLRLAGLDEEKFANGHSFFGQKRINKTNTIVVHNNWIVGKSAKITRFKSMGMWKYDESRHNTSVGP